MAVLPDVLDVNLRVVFCGTAVGRKSADLGLYYAGPGNRFWDVLFRVGLTPHRLAPQEFRILKNYGVGLTDLQKHESGPDDALHFADYDRDTLRDKVAQFAPSAVAFNGKTAAKEFYRCPRVEYGPQLESMWIARIPVFVLPSTSGAARGYWDEGYWSRLADFARCT